MPENPNPPSSSFSGTGRARKELKDQIRYRENKFLSSTKTLSTLSERQGGSYLLNREKSVYPLSAPQYAYQGHSPEGYKPFDISIVNNKQEPEVSLTLIVNPLDIQIGQVFLTNNGYTRNGWVTTLWGKQQSTITGSSVSSSFYLNPESTGFVSGALTAQGLTNYNRKKTIGYINLLALVSLFKNNGCYFLSDQAERTLFSKRINRINHVMDNIQISYDGSSYLGSFSSFTLEDTADAPYHLKYNFEYIISGVKGTVIEGHIRDRGNEQNSKVELAVQGANTRLFDVILMNAEEMNNAFQVTAGEFKEYETARRKYIDESDIEEEDSYYNPKGKGKCQDVKNQYSDGWDNQYVKDHCIRKTDDGKTRITSSFEERAKHEGKIDYRTGSGAILSLTGGTIVSIHRKKKTDKFDNNYVVVRTKDKEGKTILVKYVHLDISNDKDMYEGKGLHPGFLLGKEGTDDGRYPPHVDLEVLAVKEGIEIANSYDFSRNNKEIVGRIDANETFINGYKTLQRAKFKDYQELEFRNESEKTGDYKDVK